jgi:hypothetical protein
MICSGNTAECKRRPGEVAIRDGCVFVAWMSFSVWRSVSGRIIIGWLCHVSETPALLFMPCHCDAGGYLYRQQRVVSLPTAEGVLKFFG